MLSPTDLTCTPAARQEQQHETPSDGMSKAATSVHPGTSHAPAARRAALPILSLMSQQLAQPHKNGK